jgi:hypothetical protein
MIGDDVWPTETAIKRKLLRPFLHFPAPLLPILSTLPPPPSASQWLFFSSPPAPLFSAYLSLSPQLLLYNFPHSPAPYFKNPLTFLLPLRSPPAPSVPLSPPSVSIQASLYLPLQFTSVLNPTFDLKVLLLQILLL